MRKLLLSALILFCFYNLRAQFSTNQLQFRVGYNIHNTGSTAVNKLVTAFNKERYPYTISKNLPSLNWPTGIVVGGNYVFREDMVFYGVFKTRRQFMEAPYAGRTEYRKYLFRAYTTEFGLMMPLRDDDWFSHYAGGGVLLGVMGAYTKWEDGSGYRGSKNMVNIDNSGIFGLSLCYEAQFRLHRNLRIYVRPVAQFALKSPMRKLTNFFDPQFDANGAVIYGEGEASKYDKAGMNGIGIEGGLLFLLPEL
jgi:hypothetical protein